MRRICTRPQCALLRAEELRCECGAPTRPARALHLETRGSARPRRWTFGAPGIFSVGRISRSNADAPPAVDLATVLSDPSTVSRHLLTMTWSGEGTVRVARVGEHGALHIGDRDLAPGRAVESPLPLRITLNGDIEIHITSEDL